MTDVISALNRLAKWRLLLTGWQLGTRSDTDPEAAAVRDTYEKLLLLRAEVTAISRAIIEEGLVSRERFGDLVGEEAELLNKAYEERFPGIRATDRGLAMDTKQAAETMRRMHFKP